MKNDELNVLIGYEMRTQRLIKRMTLEYVAEQMGFSSKNSVSYIELGKKSITVEDLIKYCEVVGCSWTEILDKASEAYYAGIQRR